MSDDNADQKKKKSLFDLGHRRTFLVKKSLELVKKDVARFRLSVRGFCYLFGLLTRNNDASAMPRHTLLRTAAHVRRAARTVCCRRAIFELGNCIVTCAAQRYIYRELQTIQMKLILLCVFFEQ